MHPRPTDRCAHGVSRAACTCDAPLMSLAAHLRHRLHRTGQRIRWPDVRSSRTARVPGLVLTSDWVDPR